ncbi:MAG: DUF971 domain-containing protein [Alphaproteobacteria bacterium]|nr:DUF971 domain-containing protein [Alphaproteobacteria bacterium]
MTGAAPLELRYNKAQRALAVAFAGEERYVLPAEYLRVESPSAELKGHDGVRRIIGGCAAIGITRIEPVGNYAVRIVFDDGHDSGLYSWETLRALGLEQPTRWAAYLAAIAERGLTRER